MVAWELFCKVRFLPLPESWALNVHQTALACFKASVAKERYFVHTPVDYLTEAS